MITELKFQNFRILRDATLSLGRVTVIIGPNGSGKSTALQGLDLLARRLNVPVSSWISVGAKGKDSAVSIHADLSDPHATLDFKIGDNSRRLQFEDDPWDRVSSARSYRLDPYEISKPCELQKTLEVRENGGDLASVLTTLQDQYPERFEALNGDLKIWVPECDRILLDTVSKNQRAFIFRTATGGHRIPADQMSQGNLIAMALLTLSHLPSPPSIITLEEIDRGIHPRLLRGVQDAVIRLAYPDERVESRKAVQVIMTTHSPYFVNLFKDHPEDIVIAEKQGLSATFHRLTDLQNYDEILRDADLGEAWYMGALGGVPAGT